MQHRRQRIRRMNHLHLLQPSRTLISLARKTTFPTSLYWRTPLCCRMSSESSPSSSLSHTLTLPVQPSEPVRIVAAPGISDAQFRSRTFPLAFLPPNFVSNPMLGFSRFALLWRSVSAEVLLIRLCSSNG